MASDIDIIEIQVRDGHVTLEQSYVYCWFHPHDATIWYVGATWLHPAARAELHIHGSDPEVRHENVEQNTANTLTFTREDNP